MRLNDTQEGLSEIVIVRARLRLLDSGLANSSAKQGIVISITMPRSKRDKSFLEMLSCQIPRKIFKFCRKSGLRLRSMLR